MKRILSILFSLSIMLCIGSGISADAKDLKKEFYASENPYIVGIAEDYDDAVDVVKKIAEECFAKRGDCRLRDFLSERIQ